MKNTFPETKHVILDEVHNFREEKSTDPWFEKAKRLVRQHDPVIPGYLWCFIDMCQKSHDFPSGIPPECEQQPQFELTRVIRNSKKIFENAKNYLVDKDSTDRFKIGHDFVGEDVRISYVKEATMMDVLRTTLWELLREGYSEGDIAVLFLKEDKIPSKKKLSEKLNILSWRPAIDNDSENIVISTVHKYSGLERPVVVLVDVDKPLFKRHKNPFIYSAVTRAMVKLVFITCEKD